MAIYAVNPKCYDSATGRRHSSQDREVVKGFKSIIKKNDGFREEGYEIRTQFSHFSHGPGVFGSRDPLNDRCKKKDLID